MKKSKTRPPARKQKKVSSPSPSSISYGSELYNLLQAISNKKYFNINNYSDGNKIPRSSTRSRLKTLNRLGFIEYIPTRKLSILDKGVDLITELERTKNGGTNSSRIEGRKNEYTSHWHHFSMKIVDREKFYNWRLNNLECDWTENKGMKNWDETIAKFNDATIIIKPKKVEIWLEDTTSKDKEEINAICLRKVVKYKEMLREQNLITEGITVEKGHWGQIESVLSEWIYNKVGEKYFLRLPNGEEFHIDFSKTKQGIRHREHETSRKQLLENLDSTLTPILMGESNFDKVITNESSIQEIKECLTAISRLETARLMDKIEEGKTARLKLEKTQTIQEIKIPSYIL